MWHIETYLTIFQNNKTKFKKKKKYYVFAKMKVKR